MTFTSGRGSVWERIRRPPDRTPLRGKMITALLALVAIALTTISVASALVFRDNQINQASKQVADLYQQEVTSLSHSRHGMQVVVSLFGPYVVAIVPAGTSLPAQVASQGGPPAASLPHGPTGNAAWFNANGGRLVDVSAVVGSDNWRVIARQFNVPVVDPVTGQVTQGVTLVVGVDLGDINGTIRQLAGIDLIVSTIILVGLVVVGIAIVRASLRPLTDIEHTAEAIAAGDLTRRVPDRDPVTEVGRLGRSLNTMLTQIETSFRVREESEAAARRSEERMRRFVADASHELRTPLTAMRGYAEYYRQRGGVQDDAAEVGASATANGSGQYARGPLSRADLNRIMQRVEQESARMGVLVEDMLLLARLDQQRPIEHRPVDLLTLAADAVQDARMIAPRRTIELTVGTRTAAASPWAPHNGGAPRSASRCRSPPRPAATSQLTTNRSSRTSPGRPSTSAVGCAHMRSTTRHADSRHNSAVHCAHI